MALDLWSTAEIIGLIVSKTTYCNICNCGFVNDITFLWRVKSGDPKVSHFSGVKDRVLCGFVWLKGPQVVVGFVCGNWQ